MQCVCWEYVCKPKGGRFLVCSEVKPTYGREQNACCVYCKKGPFLNIKWYVLCILSAIKQFFHQFIKSTAIFKLLPMHYAILGIRINASDGKSESILQSLYLCAEKSEICVAIYLPAEKSEICLAIYLPLAFLTFVYGWVRLAC